MELVLIAAIAEGNVIGYQGDMPWRGLDEWKAMGSEDLRRFKEFRMGRPILMGRRTYESLPPFRPLKGSLNVVLTSNTDYRDQEKPDVPVTSEISEALDLMKKEAKPLYIATSLDQALRSMEGIRGDNVDFSQAYIIGGAEVYRQALPLAKRLEITHIHGSFPGDTFFPEIGDEWKETKREDRNRFSFVTYER